MTNGKTKTKILASVGVVSMVACLSLAMLAGCSPKQSDGASADSSASAQQQGDFTFSMDSDCMTCHETQAQASADSNCFLVATDQHSSLTCTSCHDDESGLTKAHDGVKYGDKEPKRLKSTTTDSDECISCHGSYEELAAKTADSTVLTDSKGTTVNPHEVVGLNDKHSESIECTSCHQPHSGETAAEGASDTCLSCHHTGVYECYTCHD